MIISDTLKSIKTDPDKRELAIQQIERQINRLKEDFNTPYTQANKDRMQDINHLLAVYQFELDFLLDFPNIK